MTLSEDLARLDRIKAASDVEAARTDQAKRAAVIALGMMDMVTDENAEEYLQATGFTEADVSAAAGLLRHLRDTGLLP